MSITTLFISEFNRPLKCLIVKGNSQIISDFANDASNLYQFLADFFENIGFETSIKAAQDGYNCLDLIADANVVIAHSQGASRIAKWVDDENFPNLKVIILLDPSSNYLNNWNSLKKQKIIFSSGDSILNENYLNIKNVIEYNDNHFFTHSTLKIASEIRMLLF